ncbi:hypothetical protein BJY52DRAFT_1243558, partial [Lactarius psammicola]
MSAHSTPRSRWQRRLGLDLNVETRRDKTTLPPRPRARQGIMEGEQQQLDEWARSRHTRLPSFAEVLSRRTRPPVDLFMFYLFLQREGAEDILDFWLDDVRKSGRTIREDWPEYWEYAQDDAGSTYGTVVGGQPGAKRSTASTADMAAEMQEKRGTAERSTSPDPRLLASISPATAVGTDLEHRAQLYDTRTASFIYSILSCAERIFLRYLSPAGTSPGGGESHEIYLPPALRVHSFPLSNATGSAADQAAIAQVPDMFHAQKEYCFRAMEQDAFPRFLRSKAFGNLTPMSALVRLVAGLVSLWIGLRDRILLFYPFTFALLFLISHHETTPFRTLRIREPYVRTLLIGRSIWVSIL